MARKEALAGGEMFTKKEFVIPASYIGGLLIAVTWFLATGSITFAVVMLVLCWSGTAYAAPRVFPFGHPSAMFMVPQIPLGIIIIFGMMYKFLG